MEGLIDLELASEVDRKIYLALLKGLTQIKFRNQFKKVEKAKQRGGTAAAAEEAADEGGEVDLEYLYTNLFQNTSI